MQGAILIVDDNVNLARFLRQLLTEEGYDVTVAHHAAQARAEMARLFPDVVLMDLCLPDADGVELMKELKAAHPGSQFVMMTAFGSIQSAIASMRLGALDYLTKPFNEEELLIILRGIMQRKAMTEEVSRLRSRTPESNGVWGQGPPDYPSPAMRRTLDLARNLAQGNGTILLTGESGVGKNYLARWIHKISPRQDGPLFDVHCTALTATLVESELFGHEPGAFTGSKGRKRGLLELAEGGTLFLDEIGDMDLGLQSRLLAFLDTHQLRRVGGEKTISVDSRMIAATNRDLETLVEQGGFRKDLFYRLNVLTIQLPPLRERREDIPYLVEEICAVLGRNMGLRQTPKVAPEAMRALMEHAWPGNIRELHNALERGLMLSPEKGLIANVSLAPAKEARAEALQPSGTSFRVDFPETGIALKKTLAEVTSHLVKEALQRAKTKNDAASSLGITRFSLAHYIKVLGIKE